MRPLAELPRVVAGRVAGVLTDFDGTMTTQGKLSSAAYAALWRLREHGLRVVIVTGRSAGWADMMVRNFPVDAVVAEQGGVTLEPKQHGVRYSYARPVRGLDSDRRTLQAAIRAVQRKVPDARVATDAAYTRVNMAFDHAEERHLEPTEIDAIEQELHRRGLSAVRSSVHVNFWVGRFTKLSACRALIRRRFRTTVFERWMFIGDSVNDSPLFGGVPLSVGVANVRLVLDQLPVPPAYVTRAAEGAGFEEFVERLLALRRQKRPARSSERAAKRKR